ncbi:MAG: end-binding protein Ku [Gemmatimonadales bacterium]|jgi:DNA end-binding protein Ku|nr:end-binding protein Ku [Gemmatimonadales bacterium]
MPPRAIATANISFGLVSVPVQLYSASESSATVSFNMVHKACGTRLKQQYICPKDEVVVEKDEIAKGYEFAKGQYVIFSPEEIKALDEKATNSIDITEFVPLTAVDRIYLEKVYYLGPDKGGDRAYRLLGEALKDTGRAALGQYSARGKQYLVLVRPLDGVLVMEQLHYAAELRPASEVPHPDTPVKEAELALARQLIQQSATDDFHPENYHDTVRERVLEAIQRKVEGQEITAEAAPKETKIIDLMDALKASLAKKGASTDVKSAKRVGGKADEADEAPPKKRRAGSRG